MTNLIRMSLECSNDKLSKKYAHFKSHGYSLSNTFMILNGLEFFTSVFSNIEKQGKSEGFDSWDQPSNLKLDSNSNFSARVTVKFDGWTWKTIGNYFYTTSSFVHHFKSIGAFKLDLQSRNAQFGSKLVICYPMWPWNLMDDPEKQ